MGRYAQARRRGGSPATPAPAPPPPITLQSVAWFSGPDFYELAFSAPITYDGSGTLGAFDVNGDVVATCVQSSAATLHVQFPTSNGPGLPWTLSSSPTEIAEPIDFPASGVTA